MNTCRYIPIIVACLLLPVLCRAQYTVNFQTGITQHLMKTGSSMSNGKYKQFDNAGGYSFAITALKQVHRHIHAGLSLRYLQRSFNYYYSSFNEEYSFEDHYRGSYLYLGAVGDLGLGKRQLFHLALTPSFGFLAGGRERYYSGYLLSQMGGNTNDSKLTASNAYMSRTDIRLGAQFYAAIPVNRHLAVTPGIMYNFGFSSLTDLHELKPSDLIFSLGVSYRSTKKD